MVRRSFFVVFVTLLFCSVLVGQTLPQPYPNAIETGQREVNKAVSMLNDARSCDDLKALVTQVQYIAGNYPQTMALASSFSSGAFQRRVSQAEKELCSAGTAQNNQQGNNTRVGQSTSSGQSNPAPSGNANESFQKIIANLNANIRKNITRSYGTQTTFLSVSGNTVMITLQTRGEYINETKECKATIDRNLRVWHTKETGGADQTREDLLYLSATGQDSCGLFYDLGANNGNFDQLENLVEQLRNQGTQTSSVNPNSRSSARTASLEEANRIQRLKRPLTGSSVAGERPPANNNTSPQNSNDPAIGTAVDSGMLYRTQEGLKVAYSTVYVGKDACGKKYRVNITINNGEPANVRVLGSRLEINSDYDGFETNADKCNLGEAYYLFGTSPGYEKWNLLGKGFSATTSHEIYMKSPTAFPRISTNVVPRHDSVSQNVNQSNTGISADTVAQSAGTLVDSGLLYRSPDGLRIAYSTSFLGTDACGKKYRVTITLNNNEPRSINIQGSRVQIDNDYAAYDQTFSECNTSEPYFLFGLSPSYQTWKIVEKSFSGSNSHFVYMKSSTALPKVSVNIISSPK